MTTKLNFFEKLALTFGPIFRYQKSQLPRRIKIWKEVAKKELAPPTVEDWSAIKKDFYVVQKVIESGAYKDYTLREFLVYAGVGLEVFFWFVLGECIGRRSFLGYIVPPDYVSKELRKKAAANPVDKKVGF